MDASDFRAYGLNMATPPPNYRIGLAKGRAAQKLAAERHDEEVWFWLLTIAVWEQPRSLREYAEILTELGVTTRRGGPWSTGLVDRVLRSRGMTPKSLLNRVTRPSPFEHVDWPTEVYVAYRKAVEATETGEWLAVTVHQPNRTDLVRHASYGEGQMLTETKLGKYLCTFVNEDGSFDVECSAVELDTFRYDRTRSERIAAQDRIRDRIFQPSRRDNQRSLLLK